MQNTPDTPAPPQIVYGMELPEHISMEDLGYVTHVLGNVLAMISGNIYMSCPEFQQDLISAKQETIERINFLLERYKEDLKNMPEFRDFLKKLLNLVQNNQFQHAVKLYQREM